MVMQHTTDLPQLKKLDLIPLNTSLKKDQGSFKLKDKCIYKNEEGDFFFVRASGYGTFYDQDGAIYTYLGDPWGEPANRSPLVEGVFEVRGLHLHSTVKIDRSGNLVESIPIGGETIISKTSITDTVPEPSKAVSELRHGLFTSGRLSVSNVPEIWCILNNPIR